MPNFVERRSYLADGPAALVVGCGEMGVAVARVLGDRLPVIFVDRDVDRLDHAVHALRGEGYAVGGHCCDITDPDDTRRLGETLAAGAGVRTLAHVAGVGAAVGDWRKVMTVNLVGANRIAEAVGPNMVRGGAAIFVASVAASLVERHAPAALLLDRALSPGFLDELAGLLGDEPDPQACYNLSKLGLIELARKLAVLWGARDVRVLSLSPGMIDTAMGRASGGRLPSIDGTGTVDRSERVREVPLGRQGSALEIARTLGFLASDAASYINGIDVLVDGGLAAAWRERGGIDR